MYKATAVILDCSISKDMFLTISKEFATREEAEQAAVSNAKKWLSNKDKYQFELVEICSYYATE